SRHGACRGGNRQAALCVEEGKLFGARLALAQDERHVRTEDGPAFARETSGETRRECADGCNRHDAESGAGDEDIESAQPAPQLAQRQTKRQHLSRCRHCGAFGMTRSSTRCTGANSTTGINTIMPTTQSSGETQVCGVASFKP